MSLPPPTSPARLEREAALHRRIQELLLRFSRGISSTLSLGPPLSALAVEANAIFGARAAAVWLHDRRVRELVLAASTDPAHLPGIRLPIESGDPAAAGLRLERPEIHVRDGDRHLLIPLRGWRRALGTVVISAPPAGEDDPLLLDAAYQLARQLSAAVENVLLLEEFLRQRRLLENTLNSLVDLVAVIDPALALVQVNGAFARRAGVEIEDVAGRPIGAFVDPATAAWLQEGVAGARKGAPAATAARTLQASDGRLGGVFEMTVTPLISQEGMPAGQVLVARDVGAQVQLEAEREALRRRLAQSERLASMGQFVAGIAHEMNNPLQGVLGHLELLMRASEEARPLRPTLRQIYREADRAAKIVQNLLVFTGSRRMTRVRLRLDRVLARALASRGASLRRAGIEVTRTRASASAAVEGDPLLLHQALLNVLTNAEHAAAAGPGPAVIDLSVTLSPGRRTVLIVIGDSGPGIPDAVLPHIFDPFFTTKEVGQGTGLGLAITYGIVQELGGTITAANRPGGGAAFTIELPAAAPARDEPDTVHDTGRRGGPRRAGRLPAKD